MQLDIFTSDAFSMRTMTDAVNKIPFIPGRLGALGIFRETGIATTRSMVERSTLRRLVASSPAIALKASVSAPNSSSLCGSTC